MSNNNDKGTKWARVLVAEGRRSVGAKQTWNSAYSGAGIAFAFFCLYSPEWFCTEVGSGIIFVGVLVFSPHEYLSVHILHQFSTFSYFIVDFFYFILTLIDKRKCQWLNGSLVKSINSIMELLLSLVMRLNQKSWIWCTFDICCFCCCSEKWMFSNIQYNFSWTWLIIDCMHGYPFTYILCSIIWR